MIKEFTKRHESKPSCPITFLTNVQAGDKYHIAYLKAMEKKVVDYSLNFNEIPIFSYLFLLCLKNNVLKD